MDGWMDVLYCIVSGVLRFVPFHNKQRCMKHETCCVTFNVSRHVFRLSFHKFFFSFKENKNGISNEYVSDLGLGRQDEWMRFFNK